MCSCTFFSTSLSSPNAYGTVNITWIEHLTQCVPAKGTVVVEQVPKQDYNLWISMLYMERNDAKRRPRHDIRLLDNHWTEITFRQHKPRSQAIFCVGAPGITHAGTCGCVNVIATWSGLLLSHRRCGSVSSVANRHK